MGAINSFVKEKLIVGVLLASSVSPGEVFPFMEKKWGKIDYKSPVMPFDFTDYYEREMGRGVRRFYCSVEELVFPDRLSSIKFESNRMEESFLMESGRSVNLDPGLLSLTRLILASTKDAGHRIPLTGGIYGEVTLLYQSGGYKTLDWTYPDYRSDFCRSEMKKIREIYKKQLKN